MRSQSLNSCWLPRRGFTLIELLVATTLTLVLLTAVMSFFGDVANGVSNSRSTLDTSEQLRLASLTLSNDLEGISVTTAPPRRYDAAEGYFYCDSNKVQFTTRNTNQPFAGTSGVQSDMAEVGWYLSNGTLRRSTKPVTDLTDLSRPECRFTPASAATNDVILTNVVGFEVKAWDPAVNQFVDLGSGGTFTSKTYDTWTTYNDQPPPSTAQLRGIQIIIRVKDPDTGMNRQVTVTQDFLPK